MAKHPPATATKATTMFRHPLAQIVLLPTLTIAVIMLLHQGKRISRLTLENEAATARTKMKWESDLNESSSFWFTEASLLLASNRSVMNATTNNANESSLPFFTDEDNSMPPLLLTPSNHSINNNNSTTKEEEESGVSNPPLRDIRILMIGDSLTRYHYLSLVYRLRYGVWFNTSMWYYNMFSDKTFRDPYHGFTWGSFLFHTNRILQPNEVCDCIRKPVDGVDRTVENRYYYDPILNNSVVYLQAFGHVHPVGGRLGPKEVRWQSQEWQFNAFRQFNGLKWKYTDWGDVIRNYIKQLNPQPKYIVLNAGKWKHNFGWAPNTNNKNQTKRLTDPTKRLMEAMNSTPEYQYIWRNTTYSQNRQPRGCENDGIMCEQFPMCVNVSFTGKVRPELFLDTVHFAEPVYRLVNEQMLELMGYLPKGYVRMNESEVLERSNNHSDVVVEKKN